jgi:2-hydroxy-3-keto-5-methylthiopentenyl-1-phosphate phosphatase
MTKQDAIQAAIANLTPDQLAEIFPPITRKNFVVRKSWLGRNQVITFTNNKGQTITYNHDEALKVMLPKLSILPCFKKRGYWSQSTNAPKIVLASSAILNVVDNE